jgi:hypothetical protein
MFKKTIVGALLVGLIGVLIAGAVNRTNAKAGDGTTSEVGGRGRTTEAVATGTGNGGQGGFGQGGGRGAQSEQAVPGGDLGVLSADVTAEEWLVVTGTVVSVADDLVEIKTDAGEVIPFEGRPLSFAAEQGFALKMGDTVTLGGFDEDGEFKIGQVTNVNGGATVVLRDASGRPGWAGRGRRG